MDSDIIISDFSFGKQEKRARFFTGVIRHT